MTECGSLIQYDHGLEILKPGNIQGPSLLKAREKGVDRCDEMRARVDCLRRKPLDSGGSLAIRLFTTPYFKQPNSRLTVITLFFVVNLLT